MGLAVAAGLPTIVVGDGIDRGGVFAAFLGTRRVAVPRTRRWSRGFVVNKFRGGSDLLAPGLRDLEQVTRRRVYALPWLFPASGWTRRCPRPTGPARGGHRGPPGSHRAPATNQQLHRVDALGLEPDRMSCSFRPPRAGRCDLIVLPGARATIADLTWLRARDLDRALLVTCCGGQAAARHLMAGSRCWAGVIRDPYGIEVREGR